MGDDKMDGQGKLLNLDNQNKPLYKFTCPSWLNLSTTIVNVKEFLISPLCIDVK